MTYSCVIIEDEPLGQRLLTDHISKIPDLTLLQTFGNPLEAMEFLRSNEPDILFLDVQMPELTGIELLKVLRSKPIVILTTAYTEYAIEGYELDVTDYLLKPITFQRFLKAIEKATSRLAHPSVKAPERQHGSTSQSVTSLESNPAVFVKEGTKHIRLELKDVMYIKGLKDYVTIYTPTKKITTLLTLRALEQQLPVSDFVRVHNSYIVSLQWIEVIERDGVMIGGHLVPVSDSYRKRFKELIEQRQLDNLL